LKYNYNTCSLVFITDLVSVLKRKHEIDGYKLEISDKPFKLKPTPKKRTNTPASKGEEVV
jgi:hypothetical protein